VTEQLSLFGDDQDGVPASPWELLHRDPPRELVERLVHQRQDGAGRLIKALVRTGLAEDALPAAAALALELDRGLATSKEDR
jgi:hypothetical protein